MGMVKQGYREAYRGTAAVKVALNSEGNIAQSGETVAGTKKYQVSQVNAANGLNENTEVFNLFIGLIAGGTQDSLTSTMRVNWSV